MTLNEYSSFMNDKLHLFEGYGDDTKKILQFFFKDDANKKFEELKSKNKGKEISKNQLIPYLSKSLGKKESEIKNIINNEILKHQANNQSGTTEEQKQLEDKYNAAKKAYSDKVEAIKKGLDIENINKEIESLTDAAAQLNMPPEKVKKIKTRNGEFRRTAGMILEGIGAVLSVFPGLEGIAQIAGGLGAVATKYGNKKAEEAAKEAENFDKNKQVLSQVGINSKEEYETVLNNIIAKDLVGLKSYFNKVLNSNNLQQLERTTINNSLNEAVTNTYKPEDLANIDISSVKDKLGIQEGNEDTYKKNLKWRTDPNYNGSPKYKLDLSAKKYLSDLINTKNFEKINELKGNVQQPQPTSEVQSAN